MRVDRLSYLLGVFDGEGCISPVRGGRGLSYVHVSVTNTSRDLCMLFADTWGGTVRKRRLPTAGGSDIFDWRLTGPASKGLLELVATGSVTKREQAGLALELLALTREAHGFPCPVSAETRARREQLADAIRALNGGRSRFRSVA